MSLYDGFKFLAFKSDPEKIHELMMNSFRLFPSSASFLPHINADPKLCLSDGHMQWNFPVGLAAGFDKNAQAIDFFSRLGFGAIEVGTVTPVKQIGNPRPRIFRIPQSQALRNSMGFPNHGSDKVLQNIQSTNVSNTLGINLGKNKNTSIDKTAQEYRLLYKKFAPVADYLVINISSPNTPGLRSFQNPAALRDICNQLQDVRTQLSRPLYLKISPDLEKKDVYDLVDLAKRFAFSGIIATNTTTQHQYKSGGLSGGPLKDIAKNIRTWSCEAAKEKKDLSVIGVGGISTFEDVLNFWKLGGTFVQIYTAFIYHGPGILVKLQQEMLDYLEQSGHNSLQELINHFRSS